MYLGSLILGAYLVLL